MRTLVIDSATDACSVALFEGEDCLASAYSVIGRGHAERLVPMIAADLQCTTSGRGAPRKRSHA